MLNFGTGRKWFQGADGSVPQSSGQSQKTLRCAVITMGLGWSTRSHTAWDAGTGRNGGAWAVLGILPAPCCSLHWLVSWDRDCLLGLCQWGQWGCPAPGRNLPSGRTPTPGDKPHFLLAPSLHEYWERLTIMSKPLRSNWPYLLKPEPHKSEPIPIYPLKGTRECLRNHLRKPERTISSYFIFILSFL